MALREWVLQNPSMDTYASVPRVGDKVRIKGFLGVFEIVGVGLGGAVVDVKHLDLAGPAYIEREVLRHELEYLHAQQRASLVNMPARPAANGSRPVIAPRVPAQSA